MTKEEKHQLSCIEQKHRDGELHWERTGEYSSAFTATVGDCVVRISRSESTSWASNSGMLTFTSPSSTSINVFTLQSSDEADAPTEEFLWAEHEFAGAILFGVALFGRVAKLWNSVRKIIEEEEHKAREASLAKVSAKLC